jgi:hypothetical protein
MSRPHFSTNTRGGSFKEIKLSWLSYKLSRLRYSLVWPQPAIVDAESTIGWCTQPANSQLIPQSMMKYLGLAPLA